jgi:spore germination cell wall hydrolase CwlJ-like protein
MMRELTLLDRALLALAIWREARGESDTGMLLVGLVILNRANDVRRRWPRNVADVVLQPKQFSAFNADDPNAVLWPRDGDDSWARAQRAADDAVSIVERSAQAHPGHRANHYHATSIARPAWAVATEPVHVEQRHAFYEL